MKILNLVQNSKEWLDFRKNKIGGSETASILNLSPFKTAYKLWQEKLGLISEFEPNEYMTRGTELEPEARTHYEMIIGFDMKPIVCQSDKHDYVIASLDGYNIKMHQAVEIKCCGKTTHTQFVKGKLPKHYNAQLQHQMYVADLDQITLFAYNPNHETVMTSINVKRDDEFISTMVEKIIEFKHMLDHFIAPDLTDNEIRGLNG